MAVSGARPSFVKGSFLDFTANLTRLIHKYHNCVYGMTLMFVSNVEKFSWVLYEGKANYT